MKELIRFAIRRRFLNSSTILLNLLLCCVIGAATFSDQIVEALNPGMLQPQKIYLKVDETIAQTLMALQQEEIVFEKSDRTSEMLIQENEKAFVLTFDEGYQLISKYDVDARTVEAIEALLTTVHQTLMMNEVFTLEELAAFNETLHIENHALNESIELDENKQNLIFMLITSIYFTMLSFSTSVANELIYEKSTRQLELILTSVSAKVHFYSKMIVGWLGIILQFTSILVLGSFWLCLRYFYDGGKGLIEFINQLHFFQLKQTDILQVLKDIPFDLELISKIGFILFFLMMGILLLQMILVVISSFIGNIEEAGNIQGPFYLILLGIYYFALAMNTPYQMSEGLGYYCSFLPFFNMLFMPCRLLIQDVQVIELVLSAVISSICMLLILTKGPTIYQRGILDYSSKDFLTVLKKTFNGERMNYDTKKTRIFRKS